MVWVKNKKNKEDLEKSYKRPFTMIQKLEKIHPGLKLTFLKLKPNKRLLNTDKLVLTKFVNMTITCTLSVRKFSEFQRNEQERSLIWLRMSIATIILRHVENTAQTADLYFQDIQVTLQSLLKSVHMN